MSINLSSRRAEKILEEVEKTDPQLHSELEDLYSKRPGVFSRIITTTLWSVLGAGIGELVLDEPAMGAITGALIHAYSVYKKDKEVVNKMQERVEMAPRENYSVVRPAQRNPITGGLL